MSEYQPPQTDPLSIWLHPFGKFKDSLLIGICREIEKQFFVMPEIATPLIVPQHAFNRRRHQYHSTAFLNELEKLGVADTQIRLGITRSDLFVPELNFVFGEASPHKGVAIFSTARIDPINYGKPGDENLLLKRAATEAIHEVGHLFGLGHCRHSTCVMWFSNTLPETDRKGSSFCPRCSLQLRAGIKLSAA